MSSSSESSKFWPGKKYQHVADVVRRGGRLRWFGHMECKRVDDWVSSCTSLVVEGARGRGRSRKIWEQCVKDDMKLLGSYSEWAM